MEEAKAYQATPHGTLLEQIMDSRVPKTEREHAAAREIERLRGELAQAVGEMADQGPYIDKLRARNVELRAALAAQSAPAAVPPGYVLVPVEPTQEMVMAAMRECGGIGGGSCGEHSGVDGDDMRDVYAAMIAAAGDSNK